MIPLSIKRATVLFPGAQRLEEFLEVVNANFHYWRDKEVLEEEARAAKLRATLTGQIQELRVRVRKSEEDAGLEFLTLVFAVEEYVSLLRVE